MSKTVFLINGVARSGKGTLVDIIKKHNKDVRTVKHAHVIKEMTKVLLKEAGYTDEKVIEECIESKRKEQVLEGIGGFTPREIMQYFGSEFRDFNPDIWNEITRARYNKYINDGTNRDIAVDDTRFVHEVHSAESVVDKYDDWKLIKIKVVRPNYSPKKTKDIEDVPFTRNVFTDDVIDGDVAKKIIACLMENIKKYVPEDEQKQVMNGFSEDGLIYRLRTIMLGVKEKRKQKKVHASESGIDDSFFDHIIVNDSTIDSFEKKIKEAKII